MQRASRTSIPTVGAERRSGLARNDHPATIGWDIREHELGPMRSGGCCRFWGTPEEALEATAVFARGGAQDLTKHASQVGVARESTFEGDLSKGRCRIRQHFAHAIYAQLQQIAVR